LKVGLKFWRQVHTTIKSFRPAGFVGVGKSKRKEVDGTKNKRAVLRVICFWYYKPM